MKSLVLFALLLAPIGDDLSPLIEQLQKTDVKEKLAALAKFDGLGARAEPAIGALIASLSTPSEDVRLNASLVLSKVGPKAISPLLEASKNADADVRFYAIWSLAWMGPSAKEAAPRLVAALADPNEQVRRKSAYALGKIGVEPKLALDPLVKLLGDKSLDVQRTAGEALASLGSAALPSLVKVAKSGESVPTRIAAIFAIGKMGSEAKDAISDIKSLFLDANPDIRIGTATVLGRIGKDAIPALVETLDQGDAKVTVEAVKALAAIGAPAVPNLVDALGHKAVEVRRAAANALAALRIGDKMVVLGFAHGLKDDDSQVKLSCLRGLQILGPVAKLGGPAVIGALEDSDKAVRQQALFVLRNIGAEPDRVLPALTQMFKSGDPYFKGQILNVAGAYGNAAMPLVLLALQSSEGNLHYTALSVLVFRTGDLKEHHALLSKLAKPGNMTNTRTLAYQGLGKIGEPALKEIRAGLAENDPAIRSACLAGLRQMGPAAKEAIADVAPFAMPPHNITVQRNAVQTLVAMGPDSLPVLIKSWKEHKNTPIFQKAMVLSALGSFGEKSKDAAPELIAALSDASNQIRWTAAIALGNIGPAAKDAVVALRAAEKDADPTVRLHAGAALKKIEP